MKCLAKLAIGALFMATPAWAQPPLSTPMVITVEPAGKEWVVPAMDTPFDVTTTIKDLRELPAELHQIGEMYQAYQAQAAETGTHGRKEERDERTTPHRL
jgi:hypothetical protein